MEPKIVLVNPPLSGRKRYGRLVGAGVYMPPLGLGFLAAMLKKRGFKVKILDCETLRLSCEQAVEHILSFQPDFVGITAVTISIYSAGELAEALKERNKKLCIILGGAHLSAVPEETMNLFSQFDLGVIGEGEITLSELLDAICQRRDLNGVDGIIYRKDGRIVRTEPRRLIKGLDALPFPAWDLYPELKKYYRPSAFGFQRLPCTSLITARGCLGRCSFCDRGVWGRYYREHSADYVMEMVKLLYHQYGIRDLAIYDGTFGVNRGRLIELCEMLIKAKLNLVWSCNFRVEMAETQILDLMKKAGCWGIAYGIESCAQEILDFLQKDINLKLIDKALKLTKKSGIISKGYIMVGTPLETAGSLRKTLEQILKLNLDLLTVNFFTPFPGTLDYHRADKYGIFNRNWNFLNGYDIVFTPKGLSKKKLDYFIRLITRKFYLRPKILWRYIKMSFSPGYFKILFKGFFSFLEFILNYPIRNKEE